MLILSQDKTMLLNLDHITRIKNTGGEIIAVDDNRVTNTLGTYETTDRAAQVVMEIATKYGQYMKVEGGPIYTKPGGYVQPILFDPPKVYEMPQSGEAER